MKRAGELDFSPETGSAILASAYGFDGRLSYTSIGTLKADCSLDFASEEEQAAIQAALPGLAAIGFGAFIMIADPDGNLLEVQALVPASL